VTIGGRHYEIDEGGRCRLCGGEGGRRGRRGRSRGGGRRGRGGLFRGEQRQFESLFYEECASKIVSRHDTIVNLLLLSDPASLGVLNYFCRFCGCQSMGDYDLRLFAGAGRSCVGRPRHCAA